MEVRNGLSAVRPGVDDKSVPILDEAETVGNLDAETHDSPQNGLPGHSMYLGSAPDVIDRDHEHMNWRLRVQVTKCNGALGAAKNLSGNLAGRDLAEDAGHGGL